jgi:hypothetical protein
MTFLIFSKGTNSVRCISRENNLLTDEFFISRLFHTNTFSEIEYRNKKGESKIKTIETLRYNSWFMINDTTLYLGIYRYKKEVVVLSLLIRNHKLLPQTLPLDSIPDLISMIGQDNGPLFALRKVIVAENFFVASLFSSQSMEEISTGVPSLSLILHNNRTRKSTTLKSFYSQSAIANLDAKFFLSEDRIFLMPADCDTVYVFDTSGNTDDKICLPALTGRYDPCINLVFGDMSNNYVYYASFHKDTVSYLNLYKSTDTQLNHPDFLTSFRFTVPYREFCIYKNEAYFLLKNGFLNTYDIYKISIGDLRKTDTVNVIFNHLSPDTQSNFNIKRICESRLCAIMPGHVFFPSYEPLDKKSLSKSIPGVKILEEKYPNNTLKQTITSMINAVAANELSYLYFALFAWDSSERAHTNFYLTNPQNGLLNADTSIIKFSVIMNSILQDTNIDWEFLEKEKSIECVGDGYIFYFQKYGKKWYMLNSVQRKLH